MTRTRLISATASALLSSSSQVACCADARRAHHALLPGRRDGEPVAGGQRPRGAEHDAARLLLDDGGVLAGGVLRAGVERGLPERHRLGQGDARLGLIDREGPAGAGGVPIELVVVGEEADLPVGAVADDVFVPAGAERPIGAADADADAVAQPFGDPIFRGAVARDRLDVEPHLDPRAVPAPVDGRKIAQDAAADLPAFRLHGDRLGDRKVAVALDRDVADEAQDALDRAGGRKRSQQHNERKRDAGDRDHGLPPGNATCGAAASPRSSSSKNGSSLNPRRRASSTSGNDWMLMFRLRTAPL